MAYIGSIVNKNIVRMFIFIKSNIELKMGHIETTTRSLDQFKKHMYTLEGILGQNEKMGYVGSKKW